MKHAITVDNFLESLKANYKWQLWISLEYQPHYYFYATGIIILENG